MKPPGGRRHQAGGRFRPAAGAPAARGGGSASGPAASRAAALLSEAVALHKRGLLDAAEAGYRRVLAQRPEHPDALYLTGLVRSARGDAAAALEVIDRAIRAKGDVSAYHTGRAAALLALHVPDAACESARRALALDPGNAEAHNVLGNACVASSDPAAAIAAYRAATALRPQYPEAWSNLGGVLRDSGSLAEAESALRQSIALRPRYPAALANLGLVLQDQGRWADALACFEEALAGDPEHAAARGNRAMLLLLLGRLDEGFREYAWRWRMPGFATPQRQFAQPEWDGGPLGDAETLFVHAEQGLGSAIQFARFTLQAAERAGGRVILECHRPLLRLFRFALAAPHGPLAEVVEKGGPLPAFDRHLPLMSLPAVLGTGLATLAGDAPYLRVDPQEEQAWRARLAAAPRPRVGLVWAGNPEHRNDHNRSVPAAALARIAERSRAALFSLQVPARPQELAAFPPGRITDLAPDLVDFAATAAAISALDLVISVDTAVAHLAGALGRETWLLLPFSPDWRWLLDRDDTPWYPRMRLFRQRRRGDWDEPIERIGCALDAWRQADSDPDPDPAAAAASTGDRRMADR